MNRIKKLVNPRLPHKELYPKIGLVLLIILAIASLAWVAYQSRFSINPDAVGYISVAKNYVNGDLWNAVNAYWSPLVSWLMVPFVLLGFAGQTAFAIVNFLTTTFIMLFGGYLTYRLTNSMKIALLFLASIYPFLLSALTQAFTPDLLVVAWVILFVWVLFEMDSRLDRSKQLRDYLKLAAIVAAVGVLGYLTKLYLQPLFVVSMIGFSAVKIASVTRAKRKTVVLKNIKFLGLTLLLYCVFSMAWVVPLSIKYETLTIGSSYTFNSTPGGLPMTRMIIPTSNDKAVSNWEDPTYHVEYKGINPPPKTVKPENKLVHLYKKAPSYLNTVGEMWVFIYVPIIFTTVLLILHGLRTKHSRQSAYLLIVTLVYIAGYGVRNDGANHRYLWPALIISILLACVLMKQLFKRLDGRMWSARSIGGLCLAVLMVGSLFFTYVQRPERYIAERTPGFLQNKADELKKDDIIPERSIIVADNFGTATYLAYFLNAQSYGTIDERYDINDDKTKQDFERYNIDYYVDFTANQREPYDDVGEVVYSSDAPATNCGKAATECTFNIVSVE